MPQWEKKGSWYWESSDGYRVSLALVRGQPVYTAWAPVQGPRWVTYERLENRSSQEGARQVCAEHPTRAHGAPARGMPPSGEVD